MWLLESLDYVSPAEIVFGSVGCDDAVVLQNLRDVMLLLGGQEGRVLRRARQQPERRRAEADGEETFLIAQKASFKRTGVAEAGLTH